jgi:hypothetical protein
MKKSILDQEGLKNGFRGIDIGTHRGALEHAGPREETGRVALMTPSPSFATPPLPFPLQMAQSRTTSAFCRQWLDPLREPGGERQSGREDAQPATPGAVPSRCRSTG